MTAIFELGRAIPVKSHVWKFGSDWLSLSRLIMVTSPPPQKKKNMGGGVGGGGQKPAIRGLHLTCDAYFQTRMSYSSQKSCVRIWFGLVEIGGMLIFRGGGWGAEAPY